MNEENGFGGYLWFLVDVLFVVVLGSALIFTVIRGRNADAGPREKIREHRKVGSKIQRPYDRPALPEAISESNGLTAQDR